MLRRHQIYRQCVEFLPPLDFVASEPVRDSGDDILDMIYSVDPLTGFPAGSLSQYLSDKTNEQVRQFIEKNILVDHGSYDYPPGLREEVLKLDSQFIATTSRNRYESLEDYESRVESYFNKLENDKSVQKRVRELRDKWSKKEKN